MSANSKIEWTDHTFNPWMGCTKVSPGCAHCYAERSEDLRWGRVKWGKGQPRRRTSEANWREPLKWDRVSYHGRFRQCPECGWRGEVSTDEMDCPTPGCEYSGLDMIVVKPRVFCASLADWLDEEIPTEWRADLLKMVHRTPNLDWLLLTKRPENWKELIEDVFYYFTSCADDREWMMPWLDTWLAGAKPSNVWIGTTVEDQQRADERIPKLLEIPAKVRFLSCEPLLEKLNLHRLWLAWPSGFKPIHWIICGGESGPQARAMNVEWARSLRSQCDAAQVPFLFKQWGEWLPLCQYREEHRACAEKAQHSFDLDNHSFWVGKKAAGRLLDGVEHNAFPAVV